MLRMYFSLTPPNYTKGGCDDAVFLLGVHASAPLSLLWELLLPWTVTAEEEVDKLKLYFEVKNSVWPNSAYDVMQFDEAKWKRKYAPAKSELIRSCN